MAHPSAAEKRRGSHENEFLAIPLVTVVRTDKVMPTVITSHNGPGFPGLASPKSNAYLTAMLIPGYCGTNQDLKCPEKVCTAVYEACAAGDP